MARGRPFGNCSECPGFGLRGTGIFQDSTGANAQAPVVDSAYESQKVENQETQIPEGPNGRESQEGQGEAPPGKGKIKAAPEAPKKPGC